MEKAKQTVSDFISKDGQHNTVVDQDQRRAVTNEHVLNHKHEEVTTAVDREVHQDHHKTIVQPIKAAEKMPEQHIHQAAPVEHKTFEHDNVEDARSLLDRDAAKYADSSATHKTTHSASEGAQVGSEHIHHHVHEHIQPVIEKEVHNRQTIHTTKPIHEVHHASTVNHGTTTLPAKSWDEFKQGTDSLTGRDSTTKTEFDGCANDYVEGSGGQHTHGQHTHGQHTHGLGRTQDATTGNTLGGSGLSGRDSTHNSSAQSAATRAAHGTTGTTGTTGTSGLTGTGTTGTTGTSDPTLRNTTTGNSVGSQERKVSLKDKLNPFKDADGDGKKGLMS